MVQKVNKVQVGKREQMEFQGLQDLKGQWVQQDHGVNVAEKVLQAPQV
jgi:hypothetical protein